MKHKSSKLTSGSLIIRYKDRRQQIFNTCGAEVTWLLRQAAKIWPALKSQHRPYFLTLLESSLWSFWFPSFSCARSVARKNSWIFHRNASFPRGYWCFFPRRGYDMVNQNFKAEDNACFHACFWVPFVAYCLVVRILISQMNTNIYSASVWAPVTSDAFQRL